MSGGFVDSTIPTSLADRKAQEFYLKEANGTSSPPIASTGLSVSVSKEAIPVNAPSPTASLGSLLSQVRCALYSPALHQERINRKNSTPSGLSYREEVFSYKREATEKDGISHPVIAVC